MYRFSVTNGAEPVNDNPLLKSLNLEGFVTGMIPCEEIPDNIQVSGVSLMMITSLSSPLYALVVVIDYSYHSTRW